MIPRRDLCGQNIQTRGFPHDQHEIQYYGSRNCECPHSPNLHTLSSHTCSLTYVKPTKTHRRRLAGEAFLLIDLAVWPYGPPWRYVPISCLTWCVKPHILRKCVVMCYDWPCSWNRWLSVASLAQTSQAKNQTRGFPHDQLEIYHHAWPLDRKSVV